jgi:hypothetical protein
MSRIGAGFLAVLVLIFAGCSTSPAAHPAGSVTSEAAATSAAPEPGVSTYLFPGSGWDDLLQWRDNGGDLNRHLPVRADLRPGPVRAGHPGFRRPVRDAGRDRDHFEHRLVLASFTGRSAVPSSPLTSPSRTEASRRQAAVRRASATGTRQSRTCRPRSAAITRARTRRRCQPRRRHPGHPRKLRRKAM